MAQNKIARAAQQTSNLLSNVVVINKKISVPLKRT